MDDTKQMSTSPTGKGAGIEKSLKIHTLRCSHCCFESLDKLKFDIHQPCVNKYPIVQYKLYKCSMCCGVSTSSSLMSDHGQLFHGSNEHIKIEEFEDCLKPHLLKDQQSANDSNGSEVKTSESSASSHVLDFSTKYLLDKKTDHKLDQHKFTKQPFENKNHNNSNSPNSTDNILNALNLISMFQNKKTNPLQKPANESRPLTCTMCDSVQPNFEELFKHLFNHHSQTNDNNNLPFNLSKPFNKNDINFNNSPTVPQNFNSNLNLPQINPATLTNIWINQLRQKFPQHPTNQPIQWPLPQHHHISTPIRCPLCKSQFHTFPQFDLHIQQHHSNLFPNNISTLLSGNNPLFSLPTQTSPIKFFPPPPPLIPLPSPMNNNNNCFSNLDVIKLQNFNFAQNQHSHLLHSHQHIHNHHHQRQLEDRHQRNQKSMHQQKLDHQMKMKSLLINATAESLQKKENSKIDNFKSNTTPMNGNPESLKQQQTLSSEDDVTANIKGNPQAQLIVHNTLRKTKSDLKVINRYLSQVKNEQRLVQDIPPDEMNLYLQDFVLNAKKKDGHEYEPESLKAFIHSLERYLKTFHNYPVSVLKDSQFNGTRSMLHQRLQELRLKSKNSSSSTMGNGTGNGSGSGNRGVSQSHPITSMQDLITYELIGHDSPQALLNTVWLINRTLFHIGGVHRHKNLVWGQFSLSQIFSRTCLQFHPSPTAFSSSPSSSSLINPVSVDRNDTRIPVDPVEIFQIYANMRPIESRAPNDPFYLAPDPNWKKGGCWFKPTNAGFQCITKIPRLLGYKTSSVSNKNSLPQQLNNENPSNTQSTNQVTPQENCSPKQQDEIIVDVDTTTDNVLINSQIDEYDGDDYDDKMNMEFEDVRSNISSSLTTTSSSNSDNDSFTHQMLFNNTTSTNQHINQSEQMEAVDMSNH